jgi:hypothetical protein
MAPARSATTSLRSLWITQDVYTDEAVLSRPLRMLSSFVGSWMKLRVAFQKALSIAVGIESSWLNLKEVALINCLAVFAATVSG